MNGDEVERLLDDFLTAGVFEQSPEGDLRVTDAFERRRQEVRRTVSAFDDDELETERDRFLADGDADPETIDRDVLADAKAMYDVADGIDRPRCLTAASALARIEDTGDRDHLPTGFVEIEGEEIEGFIEGNPAAIVYFWSEDCDPCDALEGHFETLVENGEIPDRIALGAVYGPDAAEIARTEYDVGVSPTVLYCRDGRVDARHVGNKGPKAIRMELEIIEDALD